jgi:tetratricopeptide (TPR) repeat protein
MSGREDVFQQAMRRGHSAAWDQRWQDASVYYQQALEEIPGEPQALLNLGLALLEMQDYPAALEAYRRAAQASPDDPIPVEKLSQVSEQLDQEDQAAEAAMRAADLYLKKGDVEKAIENWSLVTRLDPKNIMAHSRMALAHERMGRNSQAVTEYMAVGSLLQHSGKAGEAIQVLSHALQLVPGHEKARQTLIMVQNGEPLPLPTATKSVTGPLRPIDAPQLEKPKPAAEIDRQLDPIEEARKAAMADMAKTLFELSEESEETPVQRRGFEEITRDVGSDREASERTNLIYRLRQAIDLQTREQYEEAIKDLEQVLEIGLETPAIHYDLGLMYAQTGRAESGLRHLQRALSDEAFALGARLMLAQMLRERGQLRNAALQNLEALRVADAAVVPPDQRDQLQQLYEPLIEAHLQEASDEDHLKLCDNVAELLSRPDWRRHLENARRELPAQSEDAPPSPLAEIITQAKSGQIVGALTSIHKHARNGYLRVAMDEAYHALDYAPTYLPLHTLMGDLLVKQNRIDGAINKYTVVAAAYSARGEAARARELYKRILQLAPMDLETRNRLIDQLIASGEIEQALQQFMEMAEVHIRLAELDTARETFARAFNLAQQSGAGRAWSVKTLHHMADIDLQRLDWRQALRTYEQVVKLDPSEEKAWGSLIDLNLRMGQEAQALTEIDSYVAYLRKQGQPDQAIQVIVDLTQVHTANAAILQKLAELHQQLGQRQQAVEQWDRLGELALQNGDNDLAILAVRSIIALNPPNLADYQRLLAELGG